MSTLAEIVSKRLAELKRGPAQAESIGKLSKNYVSDIVRGKKGDVRSKNIAPLAKALDWTTAELLLTMKNAGLQFGEVAVLDSDERPISELQSIPSTSMYYGDDVPVYGIAAASAINSFKIDEQVDAVKRPPGMMKAKNVYALYVHGDSMSPRYRSGDLIFVSPDRPPRPGDDVIVQTKTHSGAPIESWLKELDHTNSEAVVVRQLNPEGRIEFKRSTIVAVHRVLTLRELFGV